MATIAVSVQVTVTRSTGDTHTVSYDEATHTGDNPRFHGADAEHHGLILMEKIRRDLEAGYGKLPADAKLVASHYV